MTYSEIQVRDFKRALFISVNSMLKIIEIIVLFIAYVSFINGSYV